MSSQPTREPHAQHDLRVMVRGAYDLQKLRIQMGNRIVGNFKAKLGQAPGESESDALDAEGKKILNDLRARYRKITDGVKNYPRQKTFKGDEVISSYTELCLIGQYVDLETDEDRHFARLGNVLGDYPIFVAYLDKVRGIGPAMAGVLLSEIDIAKAHYPSSLWKYAGLDVGADGKGRSRKAEHLVKVEYVNRDGEEAERNSITFNPFLKTKLIGVLAPSFIKLYNPIYAPIYRDYKHRLENHPAHAEKTKGHRDNMAKRYMVKQFLVDLHREWRTIEGLPVPPAYSEGNLGIIHRKAA